MRLLAATLAILMLSMSACSHYTATVTTPAPRGGGVEKETGVSWLWGMTGTTTRASECAYGLARVETYWPWYAGLVQTLTFGIANPLTKEYTCAMQPR